MPMQSATRCIGDCLTNHDKMAQVLINQGLTRGIC